ncbi:hypothetical protein CYMTET_17333 [Cymbomonas tetramitiformis]|uniref:Uncharacterized protein n=1 Tax=Cymbomonas tetramitiformis TaxID=36881 RepID=A0AAE0GAC3_9CHLO|nr:hypothetical protein CYMTET_17333 [Cymbomonas tetramitiformis]
MQRGNAKGPGRGAPLRSAARSHEANDAYMGKMEDAFEAMGLGRPAPKGTLEAGASAASARATAGGLGTPLVGSGGPYKAAPAELSNSWQKKLLNGRGLQRWVPAAQWRRLAVLVLGARVHGIPKNMCLSLHKSMAVVGSSDHALYEFDFTTGRKGRQLYNKRFGHTEWVTTVGHLPHADSDARSQSLGVHLTKLEGLRGTNAQAEKPEDLHCGVHVSTCSAPAGQNPAM